MSFSLGFRAGIILFLLTNSWELTVMSNNDNEYKGSTFWQLIIAIPGSILAFTLIISLIAKAFGVAGAPEVAQPAAAVAKVEENIKPAATVEVASADAGPHAEKSGEEVYKAVCSM